MDARLLCWTIMMLSSVILATVERAWAKEVRVAFAPNTAPYVIGRDDRGIEIEIVREALALKGHTLSTEYFHRDKLMKALSLKRVDAAVTAVDKEINGEFFPSEAFIQYRQVAISRRGDDLQINSIKDLKNKTVAAWSLAHLVLGENMSHSIEGRTEERLPFRELHDLKAQNRLFWSGRADVLVVDKRVFEWYRNVLEQEYATGEPVVEHPILEHRQPFAIAFHDSRLRDDFNLGLKALRESSTYNRIFSRYEIYQDRAFDKGSPSSTLVHLHYNERPPYLVTTKHGVSGLTGSVTGDAFKRADIRFKWKKTAAKHQIGLLKQNKQKECLVGWFRKPERESIGRFTQSIYRDHPPVALVRADRSDVSGNISAQEIMEKSSMTLLMKEAYSYGPYLDELIERYEPSRMKTSAENTEMLHILAHGHADYLFIAPEEVPGAIAAANLDPAQFQIVHFSDAPEGESRHIWCSFKVSTEEIDRLNDAISELQDRGS